MTADVAIVGGGPAGCATALALRRHAPSLSVTLFEKSRYDSLRPGEVLPGIARGLLDRLGVWQAFEEQNFRAVFATAVAWGEGGLRENHSIYSARGHGWHLDRSAFDAFLADQARGHGVQVLEGAGVPDVRDLDARFVVDATGRSALVARSLGARVIADDALAGFVRYFAKPWRRDSSLPRRDSSRRVSGAPPDHVLGLGVAGQSERVEMSLDAAGRSACATTIEAADFGWWYGAELGGDTIAIVAMTDLDIARELHLEREDVWRGLLARTEWVGKLIPEDTTSEAEMVRPAGSAILDPVCGDSWLAVGDSAAAYDPLSAQGIVKALRSGIFAAYAIAERLETGSTIGLERYSRYVKGSYQAYRQAYDSYYAMERRWANQPFWKRRAPKETAARC